MSVVCMQVCIFPSLLCDNGGGQCVLYRSQRETKLRRKGKRAKKSEEFRERRGGELRGR